jgi:hypothetical protein
MVYSGREFSLKFALEQPMCLRDQVEWRRADE